MNIEVTRDVPMDELQPLLDRAREHDHHRPLGEHKWLDLTRDGRDGFLAFLARDDDGKLVGYAHLSKHGDGWGLEHVVDPSRRDEGIERDVLDAALKEAHQQGGGKIHLWVFQPTPDCDKLADELGFHRGRDLLHMQVPLPVAKEYPIPEGLHLRSFVPGRDEQAWIDVNNRAFARHPEQGAWDMATLERRTAEPWFDPDGLLLATDDKRIGGFCWTKISDCGEIYVIGVDPDFQGTGLGKALVLAGLSHMAGKGVSKGCLYVDSAEEKPLEMYKAIGFEVDHIDRAYVIDLS